MVRLKECEEEEDSLFLQLIILVYPNSFSDWLLLLSSALRLAQVPAAGLSYQNLALWLLLLITHRK